MRWLERRRARKRYEQRLDELAAACEQKDWDAAEQAARRAGQDATAGFGAEAPERIVALYAEASAAFVQGRIDEAEERCAEALALARREPTRSDPPLSKLLEQRSLILEARGDEAALETLLRDMLASYDRMRAPDPDERAKTRNRLALLLYNRATAALSAREADEALLEGIAEAERLCTDPELAPKIVHNRAVALEQLGREDEARRCYVRAAEAFGAQGSEQLRATLVRHARLEHATGRFADAATLYERALGVAEQTLGRDDPITERIAVWLGDARSETFR